MELTDDLKYEILENSKTIKNIDVLYKKKKKFSGIPGWFTDEPFQVKIVDRNQKDDDKKEHYIDFEKTEEIAITFLDDSIKVFKDLKV